MDSVPLFLREFAKKIFSCGKALFLQKAYDTMYFISKFISIVESGVITNKHFPTMYCDNSV
jgi:hypothetical protein